MSNQVITGKPSKLSDGNIEAARLNVRRDLVTLDSVQQWVLEGRCWQMTVGTFSTPITGGGNGTVLDADQPEFVLNVPDGTVAALLRARIDCQVPADQDADELEILLAIDRLAEVAAGTYTAETPINLRTDISSGASVTARSAYTGNTTAAPTLSAELAHPVKIVNIVTSGITSTDLVLDYDPLTKIFIVGPGAVVGYWGGTQAVSGFAGIEWAEFTKSELGL
jgi:hypothetical protein